MSQPTWGVDVGAAAQIRAEILALRDAGCAVLVVSEELEELFEICDRLHVIAKGRLSPSHRPRASATVTLIGEWMSGLWPGDAARRGGGARRCLSSKPRAEPRASGAWPRRCWRSRSRWCIGVLLFLALWARTRSGGWRCSSGSRSARAYALGELMVKATPLLLIALGLAVCFRSNVWNIGAEGQFIIGAVLGGRRRAARRQGHQPLDRARPIVLAGMLGGMAWAAITALLRDRFNANEILVSLMLVYVADMVLGYLVYGPWKDPAGYNFPQTKTFEAVTADPAADRRARA